MKTYFLEEQLDLPGYQLHTHWLSEHHPISGSSVIGFMGVPAMLLGRRFLSIPKLKDPEKRQMLHIVAEHTRLSVPVAKLLGRLLCQAAVDALGVPFTRQGADIFFEDIKLSVSGSYADMSSFLHLGLFWDSTALLAQEEKKTVISHKLFSLEVTQHYAQEVEEVFSTQELPPLEGF